jgi:hypothetical protein
MLVYRYDESRMFKDVFEASLDPLESKLQGKAVWLLPANTTTEKPILEEGTMPVWNGEYWENLPDNRGKFYYDVMEKCVKQITAVGNHIPLSETELMQVSLGMTVEIIDNKYKIYWTTEQKQENVRKLRNSYLITYVDFYQEKPLLWNTLEEAFKEKIIKYRE